MKTQSANIAILASAALLAAAFVPNSAHAQASSSQPIASGNPWDYNLFTIGNATNRLANGTYQGSTDVSGRAAIGGNADFNYMTLTSNENGSTVSSSNVNIVVGGSYTDTYTTDFGSMDIGGDINLSNSVIGDATVRGSVTFTDVSHGVVTQTAAALPINFGSTTTAGSADWLVTQDSAALKKLTASSSVDTASFNNSYGTGDLFYTGSKSTVVFTMTADQFSAVQYGYQIQAAAGTSVIINVIGSATDGSALDFANGQVSLSGGVTANTILFNFTDATALQEDHFGLNGSVLAPNATFTGVDGVLNGTLVVKDFDDWGSDDSNGTQLNNELYTGFMPTITAVPAPVPEPGMIVTSLSLAGLLGLSLMRGRRNTMRNVAQVAA